MGNPNFPSDGQGERIDALVDAANQPGLKLGVGSVAPTGGGTPAKWAGSATHTIGGVVGPQDGIAVAGGQTPAGLAQALAVDPGGGLVQGVYVQAPTDLTLTAGTGTLGAGTYYYRVSATTAAGETVPCPEVSLPIGASFGVSLNWLDSPGATGYKVYGRSTGAELLIATITNGTVTSYTDNGSITPSGAMPTSNTALLTLSAPVPVLPATGTVTSVASSASNVTLLAANTTRKGATVTNESPNVLYLKLGATSSLTSYTITLAGAGSPPYAYYEIPFGYTGIITGIWSAASGNARVTEVTP